MGTVTAIGFAIRASAKQTVTTAYRFQFGASLYQPYAAIMSSENRTLNRLFLSATQATVSTFRGCRAKNAATVALRQTYPVPLWSRKKRRKTFSACSRTLV